MSSGTTIAAGVINTFVTPRESEPLSSRGQAPPQKRRPCALTSLLCRKPRTWAKYSGQSVSMGLQVATLPLLVSKAPNLFKALLAFTGAVTASPEAIPAINFDRILDPYMDNPGAATGLTALILGAGILLCLKSPDKAHKFFGMAFSFFLTKSHIERSSNSLSEWQIETRLDNQSLPTNERAVLETELLGIRQELGSDLGEIATFAICSQLVDSAAPLLRQSSYFSRLIQSGRISEEALTGLICFPDDAVPGILEIVQPNNDEKN